MKLRHVATAEHVEYDDLSALLQTGPIGSQIYTNYVKDMSDGYDDIITLYDLVTNLQ